MFSSSYGVKTQKIGSDNSDKLKIYIKCVQEKTK